MQQTIDRFLVQREKDGYAPNTIHAYGADLRQFCAYLRAMYPTLQGWHAVKPEHWATYAAHLTGLGRSPSSIVRKSVVVGQFAAFCGLESPVQSLESVVHRANHNRSSHASLPSPAQIAQLLAAPKRLPSAHARRDQALLALLCDSGLTASELVGLTKADVESDAGAIVCGAGGKRQRRVKLGAGAARALADYLQQGQDGSTSVAHSTVEGVQPLFLNHRGQQLTRQGVWLIVRSYAAAAGLDGAVTPRTLRHAVAQRLLRSGIAPHKVRQQLGRTRLTGIAPAPEQGASFLQLDAHVVTNDM